MRVKRQTFDVVPVRMLRFLALVTLAVFAGGDIAAAQGIGSRLSSGLFGQRSDATARDLLNVEVSLSEAYDSDVPLELQPILDPSQGQGSGYSMMAIGSADYARRRRRTDIGASVFSAFRYYQQTRRLEGAGHSGSIGLGTRLPGRITLFANQVAAYSPSYLYQLFPTVPIIDAGDADPVAPDYDIDQSESYSYGTTLKFSRALGRRSSARATGDFGFTNYVRESDRQRDLTTYRASAEFLHAVSRNTNLTAGYKFSTGEYGFFIGQTTQEHGFDVGIDLARRLSASRRASLQFKVGSSVVLIPESLSQFDVNRQYRANGEFSLQYPMARTWEARAGYTRRLEYTAALPNPVFVDTVNVSVGGFLWLQTEFTAGAGYSSGASAFSADDLFFDTYTGNARLSYLLRRRFAVYGEYLYYFYDVQGRDRVLLGVPPKFERSGVRVGLTLSIPVVRR